jgi:cold shock protein
MDSGIVSNFNDITGNGFIQPDNGSCKLPVSYRQIIKDGYKIIEEGTRVKYDIGKDLKGRLVAVNVKITSKKANYSKGA